MQERQKDRRLYFQELAATSRKYYIPYIQMYKPITSAMKVLEIGCGDGGNLLPFSALGRHTVGVDVAECRIRDARIFFREANARGIFLAEDVFALNDFPYLFDLIICHDVLEHIADKSAFLDRLKNFLTEDGIIFLSSSLPLLGKCLSEGISKSAEAVLLRICLSSICCPSPFTPACSGDVARKKKP